MKALTSNEWFERLRQLSQLEVAELIDALKPLHCRMETVFNYYKIFKQFPTPQQSSTLDYIPYEQFSSIYRKADRQRRNMK
nr:hypothetical protein [uncultured Dyadobacter sp.]